LKRGTKGGLNEGKNLRTAPIKKEGKRKKSTYHAKSSFMKKSRRTPRPQNESTVRSQEKEKDRPLKDGVICAVGEKRRKGKRVAIG